MRKITNPLMFFVLCGILQMNAQIKDESKTLHQDKEKIVYLFFKIEKSNSGSDRISLKEKKIVNGKLKSTPFFNEKAVKNGDLVISLLDGLGNESFRYHTKDPLNPEIEIVCEKLEHYTSPSEKVEFSIRCPYSDDIKGIKIEKITSIGKHLMLAQNL